MRKRVARTVALLAIPLFFVQMVLAAPVKVTDGTIVPVRLLQTLVSGATPQGSAVPYLVTQDVIIGGAIVVAKGAHATGKVTTSRGHGWLGKSGKLDFTIDSVEAVDGSAVKLRADAKGGEGRSNVGAVIVGALFLSVFMVFVHGHNVTVKEGTEFSAFVDGKDFVVEANVSPSSSTGGVAAQTPADSSQATPSDQAQGITVMSKVIADTAIAGKILNGQKTKLDIGVTAVCREGGTIVGTGSATLKAVAPGETRDYLISIKGKTTADATVEAKPM